MTPAMQTGTTRLKAWRARRVLATVLMLAHIATAVPVAAATTHRAEAPPPPDPPAVHVNRQRPLASPPPDRPRFSAQPTVGEIRRARVLGDPFVPVGRAPTPTETADLAEAIVTFAARDRASEVEPLTAFLAKHADSPWAPSVLVNVATIQRARGFFSQSIDTDVWAWQLSKSAADVEGRAVADSAIGNAIDLAATLGHQGMLRSLLQQVGGRDVGGSAGAKVDHGRHVMSMLSTHPEDVISSGAFAVYQIVRSQLGTQLRTPDVLTRYRATAQGMTMADVQALAKNAGVTLVAVARTANAAPIVPSIVHFRFGHFTAVLAASGDSYFVQDPALGSARWIDRAALSSETSPVALVPKMPLPAGWTAATREALTALVGHSCLLGAPAPDPPNTEQGGPARKKQKPPTGPSCPGMVSASFNPLSAGLILNDTPVGYSPPRGPEVYFTLSYNQREQYQPSIFPFGNLGPLWTHNWLAYVEEGPQCGSSTCVSPFIRVYLRGGGHDTLEGPAPDGTYAQTWKSKAQVVRTSISPLKFERRLPDGSLEIYAQGDGGPVGYRRVFLTEVIDPQGQEVTLSYDAQLRLIALTDAIGQVTTLAYDSPIDALKLTSVTDPFGRRSTFAYTDRAQLASVTDVLGLTSKMTYTSGDFVAGLTTPYGTSTFRHEGSAGLTWFPYIELTDSMGGTERAEFRWISDVLPATATQVPAGFEVANQYLDHYSSLVWDKRSWALGPHNVSNAVVTRWMLADSIDYGASVAVQVPQSIKWPLENRLWFQYPGQSTDLGGRLGSLGLPSLEGRVMSDGTSHLNQTTYNSLGLVTSETDPLGRRTSYIYGSNSIDLLEVRQTTGSTNDLLVSFGTYNSKHLPSTVTDASGQTTTLSYNVFGQTTTVTNALGEVTQFGYDANGYLTTLAEPTTGATTTLSYDAIGRARTLTTSDGYVLTVAYDAMDRPIRRSYPDGSYDEVTYDRLDAVSGRDRAGRVSRVSYDALRRVSAVRDPAGRTITFQWCSCDSLDAVVDAAAHATSWQRDVEGRVVTERRADSTTAETIAYEPDTGRLHSVTDSKGQVRTYSYNSDDTVASVVYTNAVVNTPPVFYAYDNIYGRLTNVTDGSGATTLTYRPPGTLGAGRIATIDGPLTADTITYGYDELNRRASRDVNGIAQTWAYDVLGRITSQSTAAGTFGYSYSGTSNRLSQVTYPNGQSTVYAYFPVGQDERLQTIEHLNPAGFTLSRFDYTYDVVGNVTSLQEQFQSGSPTVWTYTYDAADQLVGAGRAVNSSSPPTLSLYSYRYDWAGNRITEQIDSGARATAYDSTDRALASSAGGQLRVSGQVSEVATVTIDGRPAKLYGTQFDGSFAASAGAGVLAVTATDPSGNISSKQYAVTQSGSSATLAYDDNGNLTHQGSKVYEWDAENRLVRVLDGGIEAVRFSYDAAGRRVSRTAGGATTNYVLDGWDVVEERNSAATTRFVDGPLVDFHLATLEAGTVTYYLADHLGSIRQTTSASGQITGTASYDPYGRTALTVGRYGYTGREWDSAAGLYYCRARYYDPDSGRFISRDPIGASPDGANLYSYADQNPLRFTDPSGNGPWEVALGVVGGGIGFLTAGGAAVATGGVLTPTIAVATTGGAAAGAIVGLAIDTALERLMADTSAIQSAGSGYSIGEDGNSYAKEHRSNARPSTKEKHQKGQTRVTKDRGGERADEGRRPPRVRPKGHKGPWPPPKPCK